MNARQASIRLLLALGSWLAMMILAGCGSKDAKPATSNEVETLRREVAQLRDEVEQLRKHSRGRTASGARSEGSPVEEAESAEVSRQELLDLRTQLSAAQREISSNLVQIAVDRAGDTWRRGDFKEALKLLQPLAAAGHPIAEHRLGVMYVLGQGVPKDSAEAIKWFTKAAEQGQGESQHSLGLRYLWGDGAEKNPESAAVWFTAAANQGIPDSATWLGDMYWNGNGVAQDPVEAYKWLLLAGDKFTINHRGVTLEDFARQLTPQQRAEAEQRAAQFAPTRIGPEDF